MHMTKIQFKEKISRNMVQITAFCPERSLNNEQVIHIFLFAIYMRYIQTMKKISRNLYRIFFLHIIEHV